MPMKLIATRQIFLYFTVFKLSRAGSLVGKCYSKDWFSRAEKGRRWRQKFHTEGLRKAFNPTYIVLMYIPLRAAHVDCSMNQTGWSEAANSQRCFTEVSASESLKLKSIQWH